VACENAVVALVLGIKWYQYTATQKMQNDAITAKRYRDHWKILSVQTQD